MVRVLEQSYRFGEFTLDASEHNLRRKGREVFLRPKAFETLWYLVERHGHLVEKNELMDHVWADTSVTETVLTHCITEVRQALEDDTRNPRYLKTIPRVGYKFIGEVEGISPATQGREPPKSLTTRAAIVVLPFVNLSSDPENEYLCDGLSEELINGLTKVRNLRVVAHSSAFSFKGRDTDVREIGHRLNVGSVLEGSVRKAGNRLRISAQLINATDGYHVWSEQFDRQMDDVFAIQDDISLVILDKLKVELLSEERIALVKHPTDNLDAYHLYLKGRSFWHRRYEGFMQKALECLQQAVEKDPLYALAHAGLADAYSAWGIWGLAAPREVFSKATAAAEKALEIDSTLAEGYASRALISMFYDWDWAAAESGLSRAIELNPGCALVHLFFGHYLSLVGQFDEAIAAMKQAQDLDPLSPVIGANVGWTLYLARDCEAAIEELHKVLELDPHFGIAHFYLGFIYARMERYKEAIAAFQKAVEATGGMPWAAGSVGYAHALSGKQDRAVTVLRELERQAKQRYVPSSALLLIYLGMGEDEKVFECIRRGYEERDAMLPWLKVMPEFDRLQPDSRFQDLQRSMGRE
ncbi:MAG: tetratricopeptide repeat protein [Acidobacteriia bacterium]|nr:tetratricopeptide repeat protein [Terriglobia bacterium]